MRSAGLTLRLKKNKTASGRIAAVVFLWMSLLGRPLAADGPSFSGLFDVKAGGGKSDSGEALSGFDAFANLRLQERAKDTVTFYAAFNLQAATGMFEAASTDSALFEVERLYLRWAEDRWGFDAGLMPLHFGYGQTFAPSDFLIQKNPAVLDARPRGVTGAAWYQYPHDAVKITEFAVFPVGAENNGWQGHRFGAAFEAHTAFASFQTLYTFEIPEDRSENGVHFFGGSAKIEAGIGLLADCLYRYDPANRFDAEGLALSAGADYTMGKLYILAEYLYNGKNSASHRTTEGLFENHSFIGATARYTVSDLTNIAAQGLWSLADRSILPSLIVSHDLAQGFTLTLSAQIPLDLDDDDSPGELSPKATGKRFTLAAGLRLRI
jgi:hypothetical protein